MYEDLKKVKRNLKIGAGIAAGGVAAGAAGMAARHHYLKNQPDIVDKAYAAAKKAGRNPVMHSG